MYFAAPIRFHTDSVGASINTGNTGDFVNLNWALGRLIRKNAIMRVPYTNLQLAVATLLNP